MNNDGIQWDAGPDKEPYLRPDSIFWTGRALFIFPENADQIIVRFDVRENWRVSSPWERVAGRSNTFKVQDVDALADSFLLIGTHNEYTLKIKNLEVRLAIGGQLKELEHLNKNSVSQLLSFDANLFGETPKERLLLIINAQDNRGSLDGGVFGKSISILMGIGVRPGEYEQVGRVYCS